MWSRYIVLGWGNTRGFRVSGCGVGWVCMVLLFLLPSFLALAGEEEGRQRAGITEGEGLWVEGRRRGGGRLRGKGRNAKTHFVKNAFGQASEGGVCYGSYSTSLFHCCCYYFLLSMCPPACWCCLYASILSSPFLCPVISPKRTGTHFEQDY